jgi:hypothetical protein
MRNIVRLGEEGASDWWSVKPIIAPGGRALDGPYPWQAFWWEAKAPGKKPTDSQLAWMDKPPTGRPRGDLVRSIHSPRRHVFETWFLEYFTKCHRGNPD